MTVCLKGALIGCGYISRRHLWAWDRTREAEIVAVCDMDADKARGLADDFGIAAVFDDPRRLMEEMSLDFVDIATPPASHLDLVLEAANHGRHVLCQKPPAPTMNEVRQMTAACREAKVTFMINEMSRFQAWFRQMKNLLDDGRLGNPFYARFEMRRRYSLPRPDFGDQPYFRDMPRLIVYEMGIHFLDTARFLFGEAVEVYAGLRRVSPFIAGEDLAILTVDFGHLTCLIDLDWCGVTESEPGPAWGPARVEGEKGTVVLKETGVLDLHTDDLHQSWNFPQDTYARSFTAVQRHFIDCIKTGRKPETDGDDTLKTLALVFAAYRSAETGRPVKVEEILKA